jgi:hypothetical protein
LIQFQALAVSPSKFYQWRSKPQPEKMEDQHILAALIESFDKNPTPMV